VDLGGRASCNSTANKYVRVVQTILNAAERKWGWGNRAPILKTYREGLPRDACPNPYEVIRLCESLPAHSADRACYAAMTMRRRANVAGPKWSMIDWERMAVQIASRLTKTGKKIYVPLNSVSMEVLKRRRAAKDAHPEYVFHYRGQNITQVVTKTWRAARTKADMPTVSLHTMRHCGQSWPAQQGVSAEMRARLGGWSVRGLGAMDKYTHLYIEDLRPIAEKLAEQWKAAAIFRAAEREKEAVVRRFREPSTFSTQYPRREKHSAGN
jgi:integrase